MTTRRELKKLRRRAFWVSRSPKNERPHETAIRLVHGGSVLPYDRACVDKFQWAASEFIAEVRARFGKELFAGFYDAPPVLSLLSKDGWVFKVRLDTGQRETFSRKSERLEVWASAKVRERERERGFMSYENAKDLADKLLYGFQKKVEL